MRNKKEWWLQEQPLMSESQHLDLFNQQLDYFERRFGINLDKSRQIPSEHLTRVRNLGYVFLDWAKSKGYTRHPESAKPVIDSYMVLNPEDRRILGSNIKEYRLKKLNDLWKQIVTFTPESQLLVLKRTLNLLTQELHRWQETEEIPPGNMFKVLMPDESDILLGTFTDWSGYNPYQQWTLEGTVAEETLHVVSTIGQTQTTRILTPEQIYAIDEMAVKYYVINALKNCNFNPSIISGYQSVGGIQGVITVWQRICQTCGQQTADRMFFNGAINQVNYRLLTEIIRDSVTQGVIK